MTRQNKAVARYNNAAIGKTYLPDCKKAYKVAAKSRDSLMALREKILKDDPNAPTYFYALQHPAKQLAACPAKPVSKQQVQGIEQQNRKITSDNNKTAGILRKAMTLK